MPDFYKELHDLKRKQEQLTAEEETLRQRMDALSAASSSTSIKSVSYVRSPWNWKPDGQLVCIGSL